MPALAAALRENDRTLDGELTELLTQGNNYSFSFAPMTCCWEIAA